MKVELLLGVLHAGGVGGGFLESETTGKLQFLGNVSTDIY
jgi:hypothetical protein